MGPPEEVGERQGSSGLHSLLKMGPSGLWKE